MQINSQHLLLARNVPDSGIINGLYEVCTQQTAEEQKGKQNILEVGGDEGTSNFVVVSRSSFILC